MFSNLHIWYVFVGVISTFLPTVNVKCILIPHKLPIFFLQLKLSYKVWPFGIFNGGRLNWNSDKPWLVLTKSDLEVVTSQTLCSHIY